MHYYGLFNVLKNHDSVYWADAYSFYIQNIFDKNTNSIFSLMPYNYFLSNMTAVYNYFYLYILYIKLIFNCANRDLIVDFHFTAGWIGIGIGIGLTQFTVIFIILPTYQKTMCFRSKFSRRNLKLHRLLLIHLSFCRQICL